MSSKRQLAAIMFTDIAGYTALMGKDENKALEIIHENRQLQKPLIEKHEGIWLKEMGDGVLARFDSAYMAVKCAVEIQSSSPPPLKNKIRIGIHLGDVTIEDNDVLGDGVNIASRLESIGNPGGIYFSESVFNAIQSSNEFKTNYVGELHLKNVNKPVRTYCVSGQEMPEPLSEEIRKLIHSDSVQSIAVLPFTNLSGNEDHQYFVDGMHDALITELSQIGSLRIISRTSTLHYRNSQKTVPQIAEELSVDGIIEASVFNVDDRVRIQVQLIKAFPEEGHVWAKTYDKKINNIFILHSEVVKDISDKIKVKLTEKEKSYLSSSNTVNPLAYKSYLNGKFHLEKLSSDGFRMALEFFKTSINIDPTFAPVYAELTHYYMYQLQMRLIQVNEAIPNIYQNNQKALELDPDLPEANYTKALMSWFQWDWEASEQLFKKVLQIDPSHVLANAFYGHLHLIRNQFDEAVQYLKKALALDPKNDLILSLYGVVLVHQGKPDEGIDLANEALKINPRNVLTLRLLEFAYYLKEDYSKSIDFLDTIYTEVFPTGIQIKKEFTDSGYKSAIKILAQTIEKKLQGQDLYIAIFYNRARMFEEAIKWIEIGFKNHDGDIPYLFRLIEVDNLMSDPRVKSISKKVGLSPAKNNIPEFKITDNVLIHVLSGCRCSSSST